MNVMDADAINLFIGKRIRQCRRALGITLQALSQNLDISYQQLQKYETGRNRVSAAMLVQIAKTLDVPIECLVNPNMLVEWDERGIPLLARFNAIASEALRQHLFYSADIFAKVQGTGTG